MIDSKGVDFDLLKTAMKESPSLVTLMKYVSKERERGRASISSLVIKRYLHFSTDECQEVFEYLEDAGVGKAYQQHNYIEFRLSVHLKDLADRLLGKAPAGTVLRPPVFQKNPRLPAPVPVEKTGRTQSAVAKLPRQTTTASTPKSGFVTVLGEMHGRQVEFEIELAKVPPEAYRLIRVL